MSGRPSVANGNDQPVKLRRVLGLSLLTFYGLGTIVGAGIYVLVGKVAANAGMQAPIAFLIAAGIASLTAVAYAELSARYPKSAGEATYVNAAFHNRTLTVLVGWTVVITGTISAAAIANGFVGYLHVFVVLPRSLVITALVLVLAAIAAWGIGQSARFAALITLIELGGLVFVIAVLGPNLGELPERFHEIVDPVALSDATVWTGIMLGSVLAFYAFIGFEDMVNVAEEVKDPVHNLPRAICISIAISSFLYLLVALLAVLSMPVEQLARSDAPLADLVATKGYDPRWSIALISLLAVVNGALIQIIMASRVIYGLGKTSGAPKYLSSVNARLQTPVRATVLVAAAVLGLALWLPIESLARVTSVLTLNIFFLVNAAALWLRWKSDPGVTSATPRYPVIFPLAGAASTAALAIWQMYAWL